MDFDLAFPALVAGRLLLAFAPLPDALKHDQLLASPLTSYPRCAVVSQMGLYAKAHLVICLKCRKASTYSNMGLTHILEGCSDRHVDDLLFTDYTDRSAQSPLLLSLFSTVLPLNPSTSALIWTASDSIAAWALVKIWRARQRLNRSSRDSLIAAAYVR